MTHRPHAWAVLLAATLAGGGCGIVDRLRELRNDPNAPPPPRPPEPRLDNATTGRAEIRGCALVPAPSSHGTTYFVRPDGGDAAQCTGKVDAPYPGRGAAQACAWSHPFFALPPGAAPRIAGGDRLVIGAGSYRMGAGSPGAQSCAGGDPYECVMPAVPSGPSPTQPTRIVGLVSPTGQRPELWGAERPWQILDLRGSDNVAVECLEITDHSSCVEFHSGGLGCQRDQPPYGDWASAGIKALDSENVVLRGLDVHGLAQHGIQACRLRDWLLEDVRIAANGWAGWEGDVGDEPCSNGGTMTFRRVTIAWNGCGEDAGRPVGCWAQSAGGYGDGLGTAQTGGRWLFEDLRVEHNTSDGIDLLYLDSTGSAVFDRVFALGNAGNQLKARGDVTIANAVVDGNCHFFTGQPFTHDVDACRAEGNEIAVEPVPGKRIRITSSVVRGDGTVALELAIPPVEPSDTMRAREFAGVSPCNRLETVVIRNSIWHGGRRLDMEPSSLFLKMCLGQEGVGPAVDHQFGVIHAVSDYGFGPEGICPPGSTNVCADPLLEPGTLRPRPGSPAIDTGSPADAAPTDVLGVRRPAGRGVDRGAYEQ